MTESLQPPGWPPVDRELWSRFAHNPAGQSREDYERLPEPYRGVVDRRLAHEARRDRRAALVRLALCLDPLTDAVVAGLSPTERAFLLSHYDRLDAALGESAARPGVMS